MKRSILRWVAVELVCLGAALAGIGGWALIRGVLFEAACMVRMEQGVDLTRVTNSAHWDPFSVQTQVELIRSDAVLSNAVERLALWRDSAKGNDTTGILDSREPGRILRNKMSVSPRRGTMFLVIRIRDASRDRAAAIANAVGEAYCDRQWRDWLRVDQERIKALEDSFNEESKKFKDISENLIRLRKELAVSAQEEAGWSKRLLVSTNALPDDRIRALRQYDEARREFEKAYEAVKVLEQRIAKEPIEQRLSRWFIDREYRATPPAGPVFPRRSLAMTFLLLGIALASVGWFLLRRNR